MNKNKPYIIIETANCHGGNIEYVYDLLDTFSQFENTGIKFQPFKYDEISTEEYEGYSLYQELFFKENEWRDLIDKAKVNHEVWLDLFDNYSITILRKNIESVRGIKLQASILENINLLEELGNMDLSRQLLIINISGYHLDKIKQLSNDIVNLINCEKFILQVGFQGYPTKILDSGLMKIQKLKENFDYPISYADHIEGTLPEATLIPQIAYSLGADIIEKHVMLTDRETKYDYFSSITLEKFSYLYSTLSDLYGIANSIFITKEENVYLSKSKQIPILRNSKSPRQLISIKDDLEYKRSNQKGIYLDKIKEFTSNLMLLDSTLSKGAALLESNFRKAKIGVIIACRMKSTRLRSKALRKIGNLASVEFCIKNALRFDNVDEIILATSNLNEDLVLKDHTFDDEVTFFRGHPIDVMQRYIDAAEERGIDVIIRVTADMPFISNNILQVLLESHFDKGADYTVANEAAVGTNLEIINVDALKRMKSYFPTADYSEYMTFYFKNNPDYFKLNYVDLSTEYIRDYRLTLDYEEDLKLFNLIDTKLSSTNQHYDLFDIFRFLDNNPEYRKINSSKVLNYKTNNELIQLLNQKTTIV